MIAGAVNSTENYAELQKLLTEGCDVLRGSGTAGNADFITFNYLEAVAKIRFVCYCVTKSLLKIHSRLQTEDDKSWNFLMESLKSACVDPELNAEDIGPGVYLVKQLARQHNESFLHTVAEKEKTMWVIPKNLRSKAQVQLKLHATCMCVIRVVELFYFHCSLKNNLLIHFLFMKMNTLR